MTESISPIYITNPLQSRKKGAETVAAAFSDHLAVKIRMELDGINMTHKAKVWRMNTTLLEESSFREIIKEQWGKWQKIIRYYPNKVMWWDKYVKQKIKQTFQGEGAERNRDQRDLENHYYGMIYSVIREQLPQAEKAIQLRKLKAKIIRLHSIKRRGALLDTEDRDRMTGETPTIHHYLKSRKRRTKRTIPYVLDENGVFFTVSPCILIH